MNDPTIELNHLLLRAVAQGNLSKATTTLRQGANPNTMDAMGQIPVLIAMRHKDRAMLALLMKYGADLRATTPDNVYPMALAAIMGDTDAVRLLAACCADFESPVEMEPSALEHALVSGKMSTAKELVRHGADIDGLGNQNETLLSRMAGMGNEDAIQLLLNEGASPLTMDANGSSPLDYARENGQSGVIRLIEIDIQRHVEELQDIGIELPIFSHFKNHSLGFYRRLKLALRSIRRLVDLRRHQRVHVTKKLILDLEIGNVESALGTLRAKSISINARCPDGHPLTFLALRGLVLPCTTGTTEEPTKTIQAQALIERLIAKGVHPLVLDLRTGRNLLHEIIDLRQENLALHLLASGMFSDGINRSDRHLDRPLHFAARHGLRKLVLALIQKGADINPVNRLGETPLHICAMQLDVQTAEVLVGKGVNRNIRAKNGHTLQSLLKNLDDKSQSFNVMLEARHSIENAMNIFSADNPMAALTKLRSNGLANK